VSIIYKDHPQPYSVCLKTKMEKSTSTCIVCEWAEGTKEFEYQRSELFEHFKTERHLNNWQRWIFYLHSQDIGADYVKDWLQQHQLLSLHQRAISSTMQM
jgi:hypothetical protein